MQIRDRIIELRRVPANELLPNPKNWRRHPESQLQALRGTLKEIGFAGAELARELPNGQLELIDGHARADVAGDAIIPVLVLDLDEAEADKLLLSFDPLSAMATIDEPALEQLLLDTQFDDAELRRLMADMQSDLPIEVTDDNEGIEAKNPAMELRPHEHYDFVIVLASDAMEWNALCAKLKIERKALFGKKKTKYGICRAVRASRLLALLPDDNTFEETTASN